MVQMMKAILVKDGKSATASGLYMGETERPVPKTGEVLIKIKAFGLNRMDIMQRQGMYPLPPGVSTILGVEFSGEVEDMNESKKFKKGDPVFGLAFGGAYAEYIAVAEGMVTLKPEGVSWVKSAAIPENWLTAYQALFLIGGLKSGQSCLIHAGASGVGLAAIQLAKGLGGAKLVVATAGTEEKVKFVQVHGATGVNYKTQSFDEEVLKLTDGKGVDVVIDFVGQSYWSKNLASAATDGRIVLLGLMSGANVESFSMAPLLFKRLRVEGTTLRSRTLEYQSNLLQEFSEKALDQLFHGCHGQGVKGQEGLDIVIHKVFDWTDIIQAHEEMEQAKNIGKIVCEIK